MTPTIHAALNRRLPADASPNQRAAARRSTRRSECLNGLRTLRVRAEVPHPEGAESIQYRPPLPSGSLAMLLYTPNTLIAMLKIRAITISATSP